MPPDFCRPARIPSTPGMARAFGPNPITAGDRRVQASALPVRITRNNSPAVLGAYLAGVDARSYPPERAGLGGREGGHETLPALPQLPLGVPVAGLALA